MLSPLHLAHRAALIAALAATLVLTGCQSIAGSSQYTQVRYIAASPDAPAFDVYQNGSASLYNLGFGSKSSYVPIAPGNYTYSVDVANTQQQLATVRSALTPGNQFTVLIGNIAANLQMTVLTDQSAPAPSGQTALRFLDQATRVGPVDIYLVPANGQLPGTAPVLAHATFGNTAAYINVPAGTYSILVFPAGTPTGSSTTTTTSTTTGTTTTTTTITTTLPTLYTGNQVTYPAASARTIILLDQPLVIPAAIQAITTSDYDAP